jgi:hypothetical protein
MAVPSRLLCLAKGGGLKPDPTANEIDHGRPKENATLAGERTGSVAVGRRQGEEAAGLGRKLFVAAAQPTNW